jgi:F-type H+-transporting ATPase subunit epsilon
VAEITVELVAVERRLWSGTASFVVARTTEGEIGILPRHVPLLAELAPGELVRIDSTEEGQVWAAVDGGFLSVTDKGVTILAESAELSGEIDVSQAQQDAESDDEVVRRKANARLRAAAGQSA